MVRYSWGIPALPGRARLLVGTGAGWREGPSAHSENGEQKPFARGKEARFMRSFEIEFASRCYEEPHTVLTCGGERAA